MQRLVCYMYYELTKQESSGHQPVYLATLEEFSYKLGTLIRQKKQVFRGVWTSTDKGFVKV